MQDDSSPPHPLAGESLEARLRLVAEVRELFGPCEARALWGQLNLPRAPDRRGRAANGDAGRAREFIAERVKAAPGLRSPFGAIWKAYLDWCVERRVAPIAPAWLGRRLVAVGLARHKAGNSIYAAAIHLGGPPAVPPVPPDSSGTGTVGTIADPRSAHRPRKKANNAKHFGREGR